MELAYIRSSLRRAWVRWPARLLTIQEAYSTTKTNKKTGRKAKHYQCAKCHKDFPLKEVVVHHLIPVGSLTERSHIPGFVDRLFCPREHLVVLCKCCHKLVHKNKT